MIETVAFVALIAVGGLAIGVLVGRYYVPDDRAVKRAARHGHAYLRAVNHLLARDRSAAEAELLEVVEDDVDDVEPYFALAALFRGRGEWERAIRVHQAIELRAQDRAGVRVRSLYELGLDFRSAGMPRRAIKAIEECVRADPQHGGALRALTGLYEEQGRFADAAEAWHRLIKLGDVPSPRVAHLEAAAAERAAARGDRQAARQHMAKALRSAPDDPHVLVAAAAVVRAEDDPGKSREHLLAAIGHQPDLVGHVLPALVTSCGGAGATIEALRGLAVELDHPVAVELALAELEGETSEDAARARLDALAARHPEHLPSRVRAARLALRGDDEAAVRAELMALVGEDGALSYVLPRRWRCSSCQQVSERFFWRCSGCRHWGSARVFDGAPPTEGGGRERRQFARGASVGSPADDGLPEATIPGTGDAPAPRTGAGAWLADAFSSLRRK